MEDREIRRRWEEAGQGHLFAHWGERSPARRRRLLEDLEDLDGEVLAGLQTALGAAEQRKRRLEPVSYVPEGEWRRDPGFIGEGEAALRAGKAALLTVAGGQGSRLGFDGPKGCFPITPIRKATLFQVFAERIIAAGRRYERKMRWYVMASPLNVEETAAFFRRQRWFGLEESQVVFFTQALFPSLTEEGKLILAEDGGLFRNPNGHGGTISALRDQGLLDRMAGEGVEELFYFQVDNPLVDVPDPAFLGLHRTRGSEMSTKVIAKAYPDEKLGVIGLIDGRPGIIEYSDLDKARKHARDDRGRLVYSHGSPAIHVLNVRFLERVAADLPLHRARKEVSCLVPDAEGGRVEKRTATKFEMFIFDAIPRARAPLFVETVRQEEFAPLKNARGADSIDTCRAGITEKYARWLEGCGVEVPRREGASMHKIEISPFYALDQQELKRKLPASVNRIDEDTLLE